MVRKSRDLLHRSCTFGLPSFYNFQKNGELIMHTIARNDLTTFFLVSFKVTTAKHTVSSLSTM